MWISKMSSVDDWSQNERIYTTALRYFCYLSFKFASAVPFIYKRLTITEQSLKKNILKTGLVFFCSLSITNAEYFAIA